jgi:hypothetical protein
VNSSAVTSIHQGNGTTAPARPIDPSIHDRRYDITKLVSDVGVYTEVFKKVHGDLQEGTRRSSRRYTEVLKKVHGELQEGTRRSSRSVHGDVQEGTRRSSRRYTEIFKKVHGGLQEGTPRSANFAASNTWNEGWKTTGRSDETRENRSVSERDSSPRRQQPRKFGKVEQILFVCEGDQGRSHKVISSQLQVADRRRRK